MTKEYKEQEKWIKKQGGWIDLDEEAMEGEKPEIYRLTFEAYPSNLEGICREIGLYGEIKKRERFKD